MHDTCRHTPLCCIDSTDVCKLLRLLPTSTRRRTRTRGIQWLGPQDHKQQTRHAQRVPLHMQEVCIGVCGGQGERHCTIACAKIDIRSMPRRSAEHFFATLRQLIRGSSTSSAHRVTSYQPPNGRAPVFLDMSAYWGQQDQCLYLHIYVYIDTYIYTGVCVYICVIVCLCVSVHRFQHREMQNKTCALSSSARPKGGRTGQLP